MFNREKKILIIIFWGCLFYLYMYRVATVREKVLENEKFSRSGNYIFSQGNLKKKKKKSHGKVREFKNFPKKMLVNRLLEILVSIICKQY